MKSSAWYFPVAFCR